MPALPRLTPRKTAEQGERERRLAEALRENLRRRKEQARAKPVRRGAARTAKEEPSG